MKSKDPVQTEPQRSRRGKNEHLLAALLGLVQGLTEFLRYPLRSSGGVSKLAS